MKVSRSRYYEWLANPGCNRGKQNKELSSIIKVIFEEGRGNYAARSIKKHYQGKVQLLVGRGLQG